MCIRDRFTPEPLAASLEIRLEKAPMTILQPYMLPFADLTIISGEIDVAGRAEFVSAGRGVPTLTFAGEAAIDRFKSVDNALKLDFLNFAKLELGKVRYAMDPDALSLDRVVISEPYARVIIGPERVINVAAVLTPQGTAKAPAAANTMPIRIREVRIDRMRMNFTDNFIQPNFSADVQQLSGTIAGVSSDGEARARVNLKGRLGEFSPVSIEGELQPFAFDRYADMKLRFENIPLPIFNPYSGPLAGYNITKGQLTTDLHYIIRDRRLDAGHKVRIQQLEWGEATATRSEATLPVKFATSLLKDRKGVIDLDVPVGGTLDDPSFRIGPIVWQAIGNIITKAVSAPFTALGSLFEGAEGARFVDFAPGSAALEPARKIEVLTALLVARTGVAPQPPTRAALPAQAAPPEAAARVDTGSVSEAAAVEHLERAARAAVTVSESDLAPLGEQRALALARAVLADSSLDPARIFRVSRGKVAASEGMVRFELVLK